jgi:hypothetical protein
MYNNCQVCGNPIFSAHDYGTEPDGRRNRDFCSNCYKSGHFYPQDWCSDQDGPLPTPPFYSGSMFLGRTGGQMGWF